MKVSGLGRGGSAIMLFVADDDSTLSMVMMLSDWVGGDILMIVRLAAGSGQPVQSCKAYIWKYLNFPQIANKLFFIIPQITEWRIYVHELDDLIRPIGCAIINTGRRIEISLIGRQVPEQPPWVKLTARYFQNPMLCSTKYEVLTDARYYQWLAAIMCTMCKGLTGSAVVGIANCQVLPGRYHTV